LGAFTNEAIIIWTRFLSFHDPGFQLEFTPYLIRGQNDNKEPCPSMLVTPAKAGVQIKVFKKKNPE